MPDELKNFLSRELEELRQHKVRAIAIVVCLVAVIIFWATDDSSSGEKISINEPPTKTPATKDLPAKPLPVEKNPDGVTLVLGANAKPLTVADPFAGEEKPKPPTKSVAPVIPNMIQPPIPQPKEKIVLTGVALGSNKIAMFLRGKEKIFRTLGDEVDGKKIVDIKTDFVSFADGSRMYVEKESSSISE